MCRAEIETRLCDRTEYIILKEQAEYYVEVLGSKFGAELELINNKVSLSFELSRKSQDIYTKQLSLEKSIKSLTRAKANFLSLGASIVKKLGEFRSNMNILVGKVHAGWTSSRTEEESPVCSISNSCLL